MTKIDQATGLPELPEGHFWRIRQGALSITYIELRKAGRFASSKIDSRVLRYYDAGGRVLNPHEEALRGAKVIMAEFNDPWATVYGDYPPKTFVTEPKSL